LEELSGGAKFETDVEGEIDTPEASPGSGLRVLGVGFRVWV
jgi:hypothetical protein